MMDRKDFLKNGGRWAILSLIALCSSYLAYQEKIVSPENCSVTPQCKNCGQFAKCELPRAGKERKNGK